MRAPPIIRSANFVARTDLMRSQASFAKRKAKQMMGSGNPNTGAEIRSPGSGQCATCNKWHRLGNVCPNTKKSVPVEALFRSHGEHTVAPQGFSPVLQQQIQEQMLPQPAPAPAPAPPQPIATQGTQGLLNQAPVAPAPATPQEQQQQLMDSSQHMQGQSTDYMEALQNWQAKYGGQ